MTIPWRILLVFAYVCHLYVHVVMLILGYLLEVFKQYVPFNHIVVILSMVVFTLQFIYLYLRYEFTVDAKQRQKTLLNNEII